jgi:hopanoid biosynthesis associated protein HpnK
MGQRRLIVNADDFGASASVNRAVMTGWKTGLLTSASLMVTGDAFDEAVSFARLNPGLQTGLHLTLVQGRSVIAHKGFPALTHRDGQFPDDPVFAGMRMFFLKSLRRQIETEIEAQIEKFLGTGLPLTHIDGHLNIHMHPTVFSILCRLMTKYGISTFRLSRERFGIGLRAPSGRTFGRYVDACILGGLARHCLPELKIRRIGFADEVKGTLHAGWVTEDYLLQALDNLQEGLTEIYLHPADRDNPQNPDYRHVEELAAVSSRKVLAKIKSLGIILCNYSGVAKYV